MKEATNSARPILRASNSSIFSFLESSGRWESASVKCVVFLKFMYVYCYVAYFIR